MESASLKLSESLDLQGDLGQVWALLTDPEVVVSCMPGGAIIGTNADGSLEGSLLTKLGPTSVRFQGTVLPQYDHEARVASLQARGGDARGRTKASATVCCQLAEHPEAGSVSLSIEATIDVTGGLAPFVRTGGVHLMRRMLADFGANLARRTEGEGAGAEISVPAEPSEPQAIHGLRLLVAVLGDVLHGFGRRLLRRRPDGGERMSASNRRVK